MKGVFLNPVKLQSVMINLEVELELSPIVIPAAIEELTEVILVKVLLLMVI